MNKTSNSSSIPIISSCISKFHGEGIGTRPELDFERKSNSELYQPYNISDFEINTNFKLYFCPNIRYGKDLLQTFLNNKRKAILVFSNEESNSWFIKGNRWVVIVPEIK